MAYEAKKTVKSVVLRLRFFTHSSNYAMELDSIHWRLLLPSFSLIYTHRLLLPLFCFCFCCSRCVYYFYCVSSVETLFFPPRMSSVLIKFHWNIQIFAAFLTIHCVYSLFFLQRIVVLATSYCTGEMFIYIMSSGGYCNTRIGHFVVFLECPH